MSTATLKPTGAAPSPTSLTRHYLRYLTANVLGIFAGFISLPVMTRLLSNHDYGIFGLFELVALIWTALLKLGTQHSIQRFYAAYCLTDERPRREQFYASLIQAPALVSAGLCGAALAGLAIFQHFHPIANIRYLFVVLVLGEVGVLHSLLENVVRARELSALASRVALIGRYLQVALVILVITFLWRTAMGVYLAQLTCGLGLLAFYFLWARGNCDFNLRAFSPAIFRESVAYGFPLVWSEISFILLAFADRFMLNAYLGMEQVGIYTVGYATAMYIGQFITLSLVPAFQPVANRIYETQGREAAVDLQRQVLRILYYAAAAIGVGIVFVGPDLFLLCTGQGKAASTGVFQWVGINYVLYPIFVVMAYGLNLSKRTRVISAIVLGAAAVNIGLNLWWIPRLGIMGSVYATLASYVLMGAAQMVFCPKGYLPTPRLGELARPLALGALMAAVAWATGLFGATGHFARLGVMAAIFVLTFLAPMLALDGELRRRVLEKLGRGK